MEINRETIVGDDDPIIRTRSKKVELPLSQEDQDLLMAMYTYVKESQDPDLAEEKNLQSAVGIAAIQIGIPKRLIAVVVDGAEYALANPRIKSRSIKQAFIADGEGCLSVPEPHQGYVYRPARVTVEGFDLLSGQNVSIEAQDMLSMCLQHEIDHLSGKLYYDHIDPEHPFYVDPQALQI